MRYLYNEEPNTVRIFTTGDTVSISIYDINTNSIESLTSDVCTEIGTTGVFKWNWSNLTNTPSGFKEFLYIMDNGTDKKMGVMTFDGVVFETNINSGIAAKNTQTI